MNSLPLKHIAPALCTNIHVSMNWDDWNDYDVIQKAFEMVTQVHIQIGNLQNHEFKSALASDIKYNYLRFYNSWNDKELLEQFIIFFSYIICVCRQYLHIFQKIAQNTMYHFELSYSYTRAQAHQFVITFIHAFSINDPKAAGQKRKLYVLHTYGCNFNQRTQ